MPAKRLPHSLLFRCLFLGAVACAPLLARAENAETESSAERAPIVTATRKPVTEGAPTLPRSLLGFILDTFSLEDFRLDFWRPSINKQDKQEPVAAPAPAPQTTSTSPTSPTAAGAPRTTAPLLIAPLPPAHVIPLGIPSAPLTAPEKPGKITPTLTLPTSIAATSAPPAAPAAPAPVVVKPSTPRAAPVAAPPLTASSIAAKPHSTPIAPASPVMLATPLQDVHQPATTLGAIADPPQEVIDEFPRVAGIDLTTPQDDLWQRVRNGFSMANLDSPLVAERQAWYLNRPELLKSVLNRSRRYLFFIVGELEKRGMPTELALLPMVESSYNPLAYSPARASGLWQFIPSTGKNYRLEQNWWQDQRRDIIASTGAALDYLQNIYEMHGDWHLALASYNWGEGAVGRAVARNQAKKLPTDYASLRMPEETRHYVPKLQALKNIIAEPRLFGIRIDPIPNQPYFDTIDMTSHMDVTLAAKLAETPLDEFLALNPSYNRPVMPGTSSSPLVLPAGKVQTFLSNLERHEAQEKPLSNWSTYTLKKGERIEKVAARFNLSVARLKQINGLGARARLRPGNTLLVPGKGMQLAQALPEINPPQEAGPDAPRARGKQAGKRAKGKSKAAPAAAKAKPAKPVRKAAAGKRRGRR